MVKLHESPLEVEDFSLSVMALQHLHCSSFGTSSCLLF